MPNGLPIIVPVVVVPVVVVIVSMMVVVPVRVVVPMRGVIAVVVPVVISVVWAIWLVVRAAVVIVAIAVGEREPSETTIIATEGRKEKLRLGRRNDGGRGSKREHGCEYQLPHGYLHRFDCK